MRQRLTSASAKAANSRVFRDVAIPAGSSPERAAMNSNARPAGAAMSASIFGWTLLVLINAYACVTLDEYRLITRTPATINAIPMIAATSSDWAKNTQPMSVMSATPVPAHTA